MYKFWDFRIHIVTANSKNILLFPNYVTASVVHACKWLKFERNFTSLRYMLGLEIHRLWFFLGIIRYHLT